MPKHAASGVWLGQQESNKTYRYCHHRQEVTALHFSIMLRRQTLRKRCHHPQVVKPPSQLTWWWGAAVGQLSGAMSPLSAAALRLLEWRLRRWRKHTISGQIRWLLKKKDARQCEFFLDMLGSPYISVGLSDWLDTIMQSSVGLSRRVQSLCQIELVGQA